MGRSYHVLKGLREGKRTVASLNAYLEEAVPRDVRTTLRDAPNQDPHPLINGTRLEFGIVASSSYAVVDLGGGVMLELVRIPGGKFLRGSPDGDPQAEPDEKPQREITIRPFYLAKYETTVGQFRAFVQAAGY
ncbi:MAG: SUMF1/EgtB/PvdO family nonheme iron enzyme, partial [Gemmataceae bacterium]|nr:SUMF1/EgtB/PvdO family nonheme iron enzyme [Gemmataceae bacterium]